MRGNCIPFHSSTFEQVVTEVAASVSTHRSQTIWQERNESDLWYELVACLLGSRVPFEVAHASVDYLQVSGVLGLGLVSEKNDDYFRTVFKALSTPIWVNTYAGLQRQIRYRFPKSKAFGIAKTADQLYSSSEQSISGILLKHTDSKSARKSIIEAAHGIGAKQASLFLRNIGYSDDLAVLDSHILRYMHVIGLTEYHVSSVSTVTAYERLENTLSEYADRLGFRMSCLDTAIWVTMRVYQKEFSS